MSTFADLASLVSKVKNARFGEMVNYVEALIEDGLWRDFTAPTGFRFIFQEVEFDYFLVAMDLDPTTIRHAYTYAPDVPDLAAKEMRLADITGRGKLKGPRRSRDEMAEALAADPSGSASRIKAIDGWFVTKSAAGIAKDKARRRQLELGKHQPRDTRNMWRVRWVGDKSAADAIADRLLEDRDLADAVYKRLDAERSRRNYADKRRSGA